MTVRVKGEGYRVRVSLGLNYTPQRTHPSSSTAVTLAGRQNGGSLSVALASTSKAAPSLGQTQSAGGCDASMSQMRWRTCSAGGTIGTAGEPAGHTCPRLGWPQRPQRLTRHSWAQAAFVHR